MSLGHGCGLSVVHAGRLFSSITLSSSRMLVVIAFVRSGCLEARSFFSPMSSARWNSMGFRFLFLLEEFSSFPSVFAEVDEFAPRRVVDEFVALGSVSG